MSENENTFTVTMHPVLAREVREHAENQGVSVSTAIRRAMLGYLTELATVKERLARLERTITDDDESGTAQP